jgi:hypothetical protein
VTTDDAAPPSSSAAASLPSGALLPPIFESSISLFSTIF